MHSYAILLLWGGGYNVRLDKYREPREGYKGSYAVTDEDRKG